MADKTAKPPDFLFNARRSGIVDLDRFDEIVRNMFGKEHPEFTRVSQIRPLASKLIAEGIMTLWQCEMLLMGRWKGFVKEGFELRDSLCNRTDEQPSLFLARNVATKDEECLIEFSSWDAPVKILCSRQRARTLSEWPKD